MELRLFTSSSKLVVGIYLGFGAWNLVIVDILCVLCVLCGKNLGDKNEVPGTGQPVLEAGSGV
jgi:hypothetical protein